MKNKTLLIFLCFFFGASHLFSQSAVCAYKYRKRIAFDPTKVAGTNDLTNYTALIKIISDVNLETVANGGHVENANGFDIIFTSDDGVTKLDHQLEKYTATTGELITWVRIPNLSTSLTTYIYMYYGNTAIVTDLSLTSTWSSFYKGVYYFHSDYNDKSGNGNNGVNNGFSAAATGTIANAISSNNIADRVNVGTSGWSATNGTYEMWVNSTGAFNPAEGYFLGHTTNPAYVNRIQIYGFNGGLRVGLGGSHAVGGGGDLFTFATNRWYHVALMYSNGNYTVCVNGANVNTGTYTGLAVINPTADVGNDGNTATQNEAMGAGSLDNMFIQNTTRDINWITTVYNNQSSPSTFYTISAEPRVWTGGTNLNYNAASNWLNNNPPVSGNDVIINNGTNQPLLQASEQVNSIFIRSGAVLSLGVNNLSVRSDITNCGTITGNTGSVTLNSAAANIQTQYLSGSGTYNLTHFIVNNTFAPGPAVALNKDVNVAGAMALTSGIVYTSVTNILALSATATSGSGSALSFVSGPMTKAGTANFVFPIGKGTRWRRAGVSNLSGTSNFRAEYFGSAFTSTSPVNAPLNNVSSLEYWQVDRLSGSGNANLSLHWEAANQSGITDCPDLTIARWNGSSWDERSGTTVVGSNCSGTGTGAVTSNAVITAFSPFTFGSKLNSVNPLPIDLVEFKGVCNGKQIQLDWSTTSEINNEYFKIEKSLDGFNWTTLVQVKGAGTSTSLKKYSVTDEYDSGKLSYYRLSQTDKDGRQKTYDMISVNCISLNNKMTIFPNPAENSVTFTFDLSRDYGIGNIKFVNHLGQVSQVQKFNLVKGKNEFAVPLSIIPGAYIVLFSSENLIIPARQLIVK